MATPPTSRCWKMIWKKNNRSSFYARANTTRMRLRTISVVFSSPLFFLVFLYVVFSSLLFLLVNSSLSTTYSPKLSLRVPPSPRATRHAPQ